MADETASAEATSGQSTATAEASSGSSGSSEGKDSGSATQRELDRANERKEAEDREAERLVEEQNARTEAHRQAFDESEQGNVHRQVDAAEKLMRGPMPVAYQLNVKGEREKPGHVVGDPTKGPSS